MAAATVDYPIFIRATAEQVWAGLLEPRYTRKYWMHDNISDWKVGSPFTHRSHPQGTVDIQGTVVESDPPRHLAVTWAQPSVPDDVSRVTFELAPGPEDWPGGPWTCLRIVHSELIPDGEMHRSVAWGWPAVASGLKTLLETGGV